MDSVWGIKPVNTKVSLTIRYFMLPCLGLIDVQDLFGFIILFFMGLFRFAIGNYFSKKEKISSMMIILFPFTFESIGDLVFMVCLCLQFVVY